MQGEITFLQTIFDRTLSPGFGEFTSLARSDVHSCLINVMITISAALLSETLRKWEGVVDLRRSSVYMRGDHLVKHIINTWSSECTVLHTILCLDFRS
jgi:hypothetical protein